MDFENADNRSGSDQTAIVEPSTIATDTETTMTSPVSSTALLTTTTTTTTTTTSSSSPSTLSTAITTVTTSPSPGPLATRVSLRFSNLRPFVEPLLNLSTPNRANESFFHSSTAAAAVSAASANAVRRLSRPDDNFIVEIPSFDHNLPSSSGNIASSGGGGGSTSNQIISPDSNRAPSPDQEDHSNSDNNNDASENSANNPNQVQVERVVVLIEGILKIVGQYAVWFMLFGIKLCYDHSKMLCYTLLQVAHFAHLNQHIKNENNRLDLQRNIWLLIAENIASLVIIFPMQTMFFNNTTNAYMVFMKPTDDIVPRTFWNIFWTISVIDLNLKFFSIMLKSILIGFLPINKRSRYFVFIESVSQLHRSLIPIPFWFEYIMQGYTSIIDQIVYVSITACYLLFKAGSFVSKVKFLYRSIQSLFKKSLIGPQATEEEIRNWAENCPICFGSYTCPIVLSCKHIFCEECIQTWLDRTHSCPVCRVKIVDDPDWRNGRTTNIVEFF